MPRTRPHSGGWGDPTFDIYRPKLGDRAKTFSIAYTKFGRAVSDASKGLLMPTYSTKLGRDITLQEIDKLVQAIVKPIYVKWAPASPEPSTGYKQRSANLTLKRSIQKWTLKGQLTAGLRMNWYGRLTMEGRRALPFRMPPDSPYPIVLPDGKMIFRRNVGPATTHPGFMGNGEGASASERMRWLHRAYEEIEQGRYLEETAKNIAYRIWSESSLYRHLEDAPTQRKLPTGDYSFPQYRSASMKQFGVRQYRPLSLSSRGRGRPTKVLSRAEKAYRNKVRREKEAQARRDKRIANRIKRKSIKERIKKEKAQARAEAREAAKQAKLNKTEDGHVAERAAIAKAEAKRPRSQSATQKKARKTANLRRGSSVVNKREQFDNLRTDYEKKSQRLREMEAHGTYTPQNLAKQEARVKQAEAKLHTFLQKNK